MVIFYLLSLPEEIFQSHIAHWWSPDGARLAYATINDTLVPRMELPMFTGTPYPMGKEYHYPKVRRFIISTKGCNNKNPVSFPFFFVLNGLWCELKFVPPDSL